MTRRACSICGEFGHRADNSRHRAAAAEPALDVAPTPPKAAAEPPVPRPPMAFGFPVGPQPKRKKRLAPQCGRCGSFTHLAHTPGAHPDVSEDDAGHGGAAAEQPAPQIQRLRWTPEPASEDDEQVAAVAALASGRWPNHRRSIPAKHQLRAEIRSPSLAVIEDEVIARPLTRGDCANVPRPCPFVSCSHHLYLDVNEGTGTLKLNHPGKEPWELAETCSLDVAEAAGTTLEAVGELVGLTRERIRQLEERALAKLRRGVPEARESDSPGPALLHPYGEVAA